MEDFIQLLKRAHTQQLRSFIMEGVDLDNWCEEEDIRPLEQRVWEAEHPMWQLLENSFPDGNDLDDAVDKLSRALAVNQSVYMEIGIRSGAILMFDLLRGNPDGGYRNRKSDEKENG